jgi:hypothetical protein
MLHHEFDDKLDVITIPFSIFAGPHFGLLGCLRHWRTMSNTTASSIISSFSGAGSQLTAFVSSALKRNQRHIRRDDGPSRSSNPAG